MTFTTKTVDGILASFQRTVADLNAVADIRLKASGRKYAAISKLQAERDEDQREAARAITAAEKISALLS